MCYRPVRIHLSGIRKYNHSYQDSSLLVPCGKCEQCLQVRQNEWFLRALYEHKQNSANGGVTAFVTLTYDNDHIHTLSDALISDLENPKSSLYTTYPSELLTRCLVQFEQCPEALCFRHSDIRSMFDSWNKQLRRKGLPALRYLMCAEFGSRNTERPHYHGLISVPCETAAYYGLSNRLNERTFLKDLRHYWQNGFVSASAQHGLVVKDISAISYVCKYITKQDCENSLPTHLARIVEFDENGCPREKYERKYITMLLRRYSIAHRQSTGYGANIPINYQTLKNGVPVLCTDGVTRYYKIPKAFLRKYLDDKRPDNTYMYTKRHVEYDVVQFDNQYRIWQNNLTQHIPHIKKRYSDAALWRIYCYGKLLMNKECFGYRWSQTRAIVEYVMTNPKPSRHRTRLLRLLYSFKCDTAKESDFDEEFVPCILDTNLGVYEKHYLALQVPLQRAMSELYKQKKCKTNTINNLQRMYKKYDYICE